jgi:hypothetical protein
MTDKIPHVMDNWSYYYSIACSRSDLSELKNYLVIHHNKPYLKIGSNQIQTKDGLKTVDQLLKELAPNDSQDNKI